MEVPSESLMVYKTSLFLDTKATRKAKRSDVRLSRQLALEDLEDFLPSVFLLQRKVLGLILRWT